MSKIKSLNRFQQALLIVLVAMSLIFAVIYPITISRVGYKYNNVILVPTSEDSVITYSGKIQGKNALFEVSDNTVIFYYDDKSYGPYTAIQDSSAIPASLGNMGGKTIGLEVYERDKLLFRGGAIDLGSDYWLSGKDKAFEHIKGLASISYSLTETDSYGDPIDPMKPPIMTIYELVYNPKITHKGDSIGWFAGVFISALNAITIIYADSLFRHRLSFIIRNSENAEPSEFEMFNRYLSWILMTIVSFAIFMVGLR